MWNSVLSTKDAKYATLDIANFYLGTPLERYEYMKMPIEISPHTSKNNISWMRRYIKGMYGWRYVRRSTDYHKQEFLLTNNYVKNWHRTDTTK